MTINPHPFVLTTASERRRAELLTHVERDRRLRLAQVDASRHQRWLASRGPRAASGIVALLLAATRQG